MIKIGNNYFFLRKKPTRKQLEAALERKDDIIRRFYKEIELRSIGFCPHCGRKINANYMKYWRDSNETNDQRRI